MTAAPDTRAVADTGPVSITVAVCTFQRPALLARALASLDVLTIPPGAAVDIVVVDNDPAGSAGSLVRGMTLAHRLRYLHEPEPGIAAARNSALRAASSSDYVAFIDDDEVAEPGWLAALLATATAYDADVVAGPTNSAFAKTPPAWIQAGGFFARAVARTGSPVPYGACGNLLLRTSALQRLDHHFDNRFGLTGGEDSEFTARLLNRGARLVWCQEAITTEDVPAERITARWVLRRSYRMGNTLGRLQMSAGVRLARPRIVGGGFARLLAGTASMALSPLPRREHWAVGLRLACRGAGMVAAGTGVSIVEYRR